MARIMTLDWKHLIAEILLVLVLQLTATPTVSSQLTYAVIPESDSGELCHRNFTACFPLRYYISDAQIYFTSNVSMVFLAGDHVLQSGSVNISSAHNFMMTSYAFYSDNYSFPFYTSISCSNNSGFNFTNVSNLTVKGLTLLQCVQMLPNIYYNHTVHAALSIINAVNLTMQNVTVLNSIGYGLNAEGVFGFSLVKNCIFKNNRGTNNISGGNARIVYYKCGTKSVYLSIQSSSFENGHHAHADGLRLSVNCRWCPNTSIEIDGVVLRGHRTKEYGANMVMYFYDCHHCGYGYVRVKVLNSWVEDGRSREGGGLFVKIIDKEYNIMHSDDVNTTLSHKKSDKNLTLLHVQNTTFIRNVAKLSGGAVYSEHWETKSASQQIQIIFNSCVFSHNSADFFYRFPHGGTAVELINYHIPFYIPHTYPQLLATLNFENCTFSQNFWYNRYRDDRNAISAALFLNDHPCITISNSTFIGNKCTAIVADHSNILFEGEVVIKNNTGGNGGGLVLCDQSFMALKNHTKVEFLENHAEYLGGGIFIENSCIDVKIPCFFQVEPGRDKNWEPDQLSEITIEMKGNTAKFGTALYGGNADYCFVFHEQTNIRGVTGVHVFEKIFNISNESSNLSVITSDPIGLCFCNNESALSETCNYRSCCSNPSVCHLQKNCNPYFWNTSLHVYPGGYIDLPVVVIGQRFGAVAGSVLATIQTGPDHKDMNTTFSNHKKRMLHELRDTSCKHSNLGYRIISPPKVLSITLQIQDSSNLVKGKYTELEVSVTIDDCPLGFQLNKEKFECECNDRLKSLGYQCNIVDQSFALNGVPVLDNSIWIGNLTINGSKHLIYSRDCRLGYCTGNVNVTESNFDSQCDSNRTGFLCGTCRKGYSVTFGSSECRKCSNKYLLFVVLYFLGGLLLIVFLLVCNITVTTGTLSGLIFYANVLDIHRHLFIVHSNAYVELIIGILNLDPDINRCFYDGMDEYQKLWIQIFYPVYLLFLAGLLTMLSRKYNIVSRLVRKNGTKLIATIFLLSYTKLTRFIVQMLSKSTYKWEDDYQQKHRRYVWYIDGNVPYWSAKHSVSFVVAVVILVVFIAPFTLVLTFIQPLQKVNLRCINYFLTKFKPLLDAFTAPYKDTHRFWPGLLLVIRLVMLAGYIDNRELAVVVVIAVFIIMFFMWSLRGVYKVPLLNVLETSFYLNVGMLALLVTRMRQEKGYAHRHYRILVLISITIATTEFLLIVLYEVHKQLLSLSQYRSIWEKMKRMVRRHILRRNTDPNEGRNDPAIGTPLEELSPDLPPVVRFDRYRESLLSYDSIDQ